MIPYARQSISEVDIEAVVAALRSDWLTQGPKILEFEKGLGKVCGGVEVVAVSNATAALHLACMAMGIGKGDRVWTSPISFVASANAAAHLGATLDFVDVEPMTANLSISSLEQKLVDAEKRGALPKLLIPVHFAGASCRMREMRELSRQYGFQILEDASHAVGATYTGKPVGCGEFSDGAVFSFHAVKIITTGEGGAFLSRNQELAERVARLRTHGITRRLDEMREPNPGGWYYEQLELGLNYRLTDFQAALGLSQLGRLPEFVHRRREIASRYRKELQGLPMRCLEETPEGESSYHLFVIRVEAQQHRQIFDAIRKKGVAVNLHYIPIPWQPYYQDLGFRRGGWPEAEQFYQEAISLPMYPGLTDEQQSKVIEVVRETVA